MGYGYIGARQTLEGSLADADSVVVAAESLIEYSTLVGIPTIWDVPDCVDVCHGLLLRLADLVYRYDTILLLGCQLEQETNISYEFVEHAKPVDITAVRIYSGLINLPADIPSLS